LFTDSNIYGNAISFRAAAAAKKQAGHKLEKLAGAMSIDIQAD
jgi:hypothetical protein